MLRACWAAASLSLVLAACGGKSEDKKDDPGSAQVDPPKPPDPKGSAAVKKEPEEPEPAMEPVKAGGNGADLAIVPLDSETVVGINLAEIQQSAVWKDMIQPKIMVDDVKSALGEIKAKCNYDLLASGKSATIGMKASGGGRDAVIVLHGADKAKVTACADKLTKAPPANVEVVKDGDAIVIKQKGGANVVALSFIDDTTAVGVVGTKANAAGVKGVIDAKQGLSTSARFVATYNKLATDDSMWFVVNNKAAFDKAAALGLKLKQVSGSMKVSDGLTVDIRLKTASADQATQWAATLGSQFKPAVGVMFEKADSVADGNDVKLSAVIAGKKLPMLLDQVKMAMGMAGGMQKP
jgi:hypothetical protein